MLAQSILVASRPIRRAQARRPKPISPQTQPEASFRQEPQVPPPNFVASAVQKMKDRARFSSNLALMSASMRNGRGAGICHGRQG
ncbi:hypothetical protein BFW01_g5315 [Lasiodiplodia theobromae]|nr:hypothetical protein BFW01_g5315 [Lasiodiplodia theobromae]